MLAPRTIVDHGPLMVSGFLGTVIALERAVASGRSWAYLGPLLCAVGVVLQLVAPPGPAAWMQLAGSAVVVAVLVQVLRGDRALHHAVLASAAVGWLVGNALLASGQPVFAVVPFWMLFLVGTISAERLELNRLLPRTRTTRGAFLLAAVLVATGAVLTLWWPNPGMRLLGAGELGLSLWMWRYDVARRTVRQTGAVRFIAASLLSGYFWLGVSGVLALAFGQPFAGPRYDALLHATFVGFVFSMIFGHALVIIPAVLGVRVNYHRRFYAHLALLHGSLALRVVGDLINSADLRRAGGWINVVAILLFIGSTAAATKRARPQPRAAAGKPVPAATTR